MVCVLYSSSVAFRTEHGIGLIFGGLIGLMILASCCIICKYNSQHSFLPLFYLTERHIVNTSMVNQSSHHFFGQRQHGTCF